MTDQEIEGAIESVRCKGQNLNADDTRAYIAEMLVELLSWRRGDRQRIAGKNFARFKTPKEALAEFESEKTILHNAWCAIEWLMCDYSPDRLTYLNNLSKCSMGTAKLYKEVEKLKKNLK